MLKKQELYEPRFFWLFADVLLARFFFSLRDSVSKLDKGMGFRDSFQTRVSAAMNSLTYKFTVIDIVAQTLAKLRRFPLARE